MRRRGFWLSVMGVIAMTICSGASADSSIANGSITLGGGLGDWGVTTPTLASGNNWVSGQGVYQIEDLNDTFGTNVPVGPGYGGQDFDLEALYTGFDAISNTLYVAFVTGFDIEDEGSYFPGDLFIDFGYTGADYNPGGAYNYNGSNILNSGHSWDLAFVLSGSAAGDPVNASSTSVNAVKPTSIDDAPTGSAGYLSGPLQVLTSTSAGTAGFGYTDNWGGFDHNVYEFSYVVTDTNWLDQLTTGGLVNDGWTVQWTMSCGNDVLSLGADPVFVTPPQDNLVPVPAAAPLGLLGMGLLALVRRVRRRPAC